MKKNTFLSFVTSITMAIGTAYAQESVFTNAKVEKVQLYFNGAEIQQVTKTQLPKGTSEVVIMNVANDLDQNSIQIKSVAGVTILSVQFSNKPLEGYKHTQNSQATQSLQDSIKVIENQIDRNNSLKNTMLKSIELLDANKQLLSSNMTTAELSKLVEFYKTKRFDFQKEIKSTENQIVTLTEKLQNLKFKLGRILPQNPEKSGCLILQVMNENAGRVPFQLNYVAMRAWWRPFYEIRSEKLNAPVSLKYNAEVVQQTGVNWNDVTISLSSGYVNQQTQVPVLDTWFVTPQERVGKRKLLAEARQMRTPNVKKETASFSKDLETAKMVEVEEDVEYVDNSLGDVVFAEETQLNVVFDIKLPYTILSNGKKHSVSLKNIEIPATYSYYSVPKYDLGAFLMGEIRDYGKYNLLSGDANLVFEGMYVGKTYINPENASEKMRFSFGRDKKIAFERKLISKNSETKTFTSKKVETFTYEISVQNNKKESVSITFDDQIPVSTDKDVKITLTESSNAIFDKEKGTLKWDLTLKPNENQKVRFTYQVEYDKEVKVYLD